VNHNLITHLRRKQPDLDVLGKWAYIGNPKTGQKSVVMKTLADRIICYRRGPRNWIRVWDNIIVPNIDNVLFFTFVRNPWDKVVSAFHYLKQRRPNRIGSDWEFTDYVKCKLGVIGTSIDIHFKEQTHSFMFNGKPIKQMFVGRFENIQNDWDKIAKKIDAPPILAHDNKSTHDDYRKYYNKECYDIVKKLYQEEIDLLGYSFGQ